jgi:hypothetical protein
LNAMMKPGAAETAPLLQRDETLISKPKPGAIAAAVRQAKRGVGVFGVALALSGVLVAIGMASPDATKKPASASSWENQNLHARRRRRGPEGKAHRLSRSWSPQRATRGNATRDAPIY